MSTRRGPEVRFHLINQRPAVEPPRAGNLRPFQQSPYHFMAADPAAHFSDPVRWPINGNRSKRAQTRAESLDPEHGDSF
jgi:hypothetical protein